MVVEKRATKNGNIIVIFEDLTGRISVLVKQDKKEVYKKAQPKGPETRDSSRESKEEEPAGQPRGKDDKVVDAEFKVEDDK